jgi:rhamnose transport system permease protein
VNLLRSRSAVLLLLIVLLFAFAAWQEPKFLTTHSQLLLASHLWELAVVSVPMLLIIMIGGIDLSIGAIVALASVVLGLCYERWGSAPVGALLAILTGLGLGFANGWFVAKIKVHPLIVTLATMATFRGIAEGISLARPISGYPAGFLTLSSGRLLGVPYPALVFIVMAAGSWFILRWTHLGRWIVAIGTEETVARFSKIPVDRVKLLLYGLSGLACGLAATLLVARNNTAKADLGMGLELEAITAVVLGGASIEGGKGSVSGVVLALLLIHELREFVSWHWKQSELNLIVLGVLLIAALLIERGLVRPGAQSA